MSASEARETAEKGSHVPPYIVIAALDELEAELDSTRAEMGRAQKHLDRVILQRDALIASAVKRGAL